MHELHFGVALLVGLTVAGLFGLLVLYVVQLLR